MLHLMVQGIQALGPGRFSERDSWGKARLEKREENMGKMNDWLVVFRPTPLKNDGVVVIIPNNYLEKKKVPNHQPENDGTWGFNP